MHDRSDVGSPAAAAQRNWTRSARVARTTPAALQALNVIHGNGGQIEFESCGQRLRAVLEPPGADWAAQWALSARLTDKAWSFEFDTLEPLLPGIDESARDADSDVRAALGTQLAMSAWTALVPSSVATPPPPVWGPAQATIDPERICVGVRLSNQLTGAEMRGRIYCNGLAAAGALAAGWARASAGMPVPLLWIDVRFGVGTQVISVADLRTLGAGDVILMPSLPLVQGRWRALVLAGKGRTAIAVAQVEGDSIVVHQLQSSDSQAPAGAQQTDLLDAVSVEIGFEIGRRPLPLAELLRLSPGYVFDLGARPEGDIVELTLNGATIGLGHLILIGDALGVRVASLTLGRGGPGGLQAAPQPSRSDAALGAAPPAATAET